MLFELNESGMLMVAGDRFLMPPRVTPGMVVQNNDAGEGPFSLRRDEHGCRRN